MVGWGGLLKEVHKELNLEKEEDLVHIDEDKADDIEGIAYILVARWNWKRRDYYVD